MLQIVFKFYITLSLHSNCKFWTDQNRLGHKTTILQLGSGLKLQSLKDNFKGSFRGQVFHLNVI